MKSKEEKRLKLIRKKLKVTESELLKKELRKELSLLKKELAEQKQSLELIS